MKKSLAIVLIGLVLSSCSMNPEAHMAFEEVRYIREFPRTYSLTAQDAESVDFGIIGTQDFIVHDSLLILSTANKNGFLTFLSLPDHRNLGSYLLLGNGPQEFIMPPWISQSGLLSGKRRFMLYFAQRGPETAGVFQCYPNT